MRATGIVRRIDDLGRIVIPKEIRRTMHIRVGDPLEIYTDKGGQVIFKKYSPIGELSHFSSQYAEVLYRTCGYPILIADRESIISSYGISKKEAVNCPLTADFSNVLEERKPFIATAEQKLYAAENLHREVALAVPILAASDMAGAVILLKLNNNSVPGNSELKLAAAAAALLAKQIEE